MGTLGRYLQDARLAKEMDLRDAAQQTRISIQYLKALESEDFSKLPGEVFVRGFLKNYSRFLNLDESEVMRKYAELKPEKAKPAEATPSEDNVSEPKESTVRKETPIEPFVWGAIIVVLLLVFLFTSLPMKSAKKALLPSGSAAPALISRESASLQETAPRKLSLEVVAMEDTWLLVRTDDSPQKKAVLKRGESLTWRADERFLLSYERAGAIKLLLNGAELTVEGPREAIVRDLAITRAGIVSRPSQTKTFPAKKLKRLPAVQSQPMAQPPQPATENAPEQQAPVTTVPSSPQEQQPAPSAAPTSTPQQEAPQVAPQQAPSQ